MIASLRGRLKAKEKDCLIVDVSGVGFKVHVPTTLLDRVEGPGHEVELFTYLHVRENELALYGCASQEEMALFELLLSVSGVGPKVALAILSAIPPEAFRAAIAQEDAGLIARVPGIGPKTARKIIFHLKDKVEMAPSAAAVPALMAVDAEVVAALTALGYNLIEAQAAVQALPAEELEVEERVRLALQYFASP
jgi:Holliday junction DNA helicase RuvA